MQEVYCKVLPQHEFAAKQACFHFLYEPTRHPDVFNRCFTEHVYVFTADVHLLITVNPISNVMVSRKASIAVIVGLLVLAVVAITLGTVLTALSQQPEEDTPVIIIGAGVSGAKAALELSKANRSFLIIEAQDRVGGRLLNVPLGNMNLGVEMGANWMEDYGNGHEIEKYVRDRNLLKMTPTNFTDRVYVASDGSTVPSQDSWEKFLPAYSNAVQAKPTAPDMSVGAAMKRFSNWTATTPLECAFMSYAVDYPSGLSGDKVSRKRVYEDQTEPDPKDYQFVLSNATSGYSNIVHQLLKDSGVNNPRENSSMLLLNSPVQRIQYNSTGVSILLKNGTIIKASAAISTVSAAVLKAAVANGSAGEKELEFSPTLPERKVKALSKVRMGYYTKYFLRFNSPVFTASDPLLLLPAYNCTLKANVQNLNKAGFYPGSNAVLVTLLSETSARLSKLPGEVALEEVLEIIRNISAKNITKTDIIASQSKFWNNEPYIRGAFSDHAIGFTGADLKALKEPEGQLFFAGETLGETDYGTVTAAWDSGKEVAKRLLSARGDI